MPATSAITVTKATVTRWQPDNAANPTQNVLMEQRDVTVKLADRSNNPDLSPIVAQYVLESAVDPAHPDGDPAKYKDYLTAARNGLLTVTGMTSQVLTPPPLAPRQ